MYKRKNTFMIYKKEYKEKNKYNLKKNLHKKIICATIDKLKVK